MSATYTINQKLTDVPLLKLWNVTVEPGNRPYRDHRHTYFELVLIKKGCGIYTTANKDYEISENDIMVFSSNEIHCITDVKNDEMKIMNIHFEPRYLWGSSTDSLSDKHSSFCFSHSPLFENRIGGNTELADIIKKHMLEIENEFTSQNDEHKLMIRLKLYEIIVLLIRESSYFYESEVSVTRSQTQTIKKSIDYININLNKPLTLSQISTEVYMSPTYFSALFKQINNINVWNYIVMKRIDLAMNLIDKNDDLTMLEIAMKCGFNNTANFNKAFKKYSGTTPTTYKKHKDIKLS